ncbi:hypothetical protein [Mucilaginibacter pedocola]|uniref:DUF4488 domain-containing protein n=1 Tax=Mucilaginibacter pedocola TaxID=1792845 RepID=A0A1S9PH21_9SPHI|nr:hypothetical protein [Mucilaginibacter pedocola]OOQ60264.1 hypothetical protein BC343_26265 [Mucilaginibacter pedocola]
MRKITLAIAGIFAFMLFTAKAQAQTAPSFYAGKWDILIKGTPNGDVHLMFTLTEKDGKLDGTFTDPESKKEVPVTKIETADGKVTLYFTISNYDVNLAMEKVDDTHIKGSLMGMFESTGERVKQ